MPQWYIIANKALPQKYPVKWECLKFWNSMEMLCLIMLGDTRGWIWTAEWRNGVNMMRLICAESCVCVCVCVKGQWQGKAAHSLCAHRGKRPQIIDSLSLKHDQRSSRNIPTGSNALFREDTKWVEGNAGHFCSVINQENSGYFIFMFCLAFFKVYKLNCLVPPPPNY